MKIRLTPDAEAQVAAIDTWWRQNRLAAPDLFADELSDTLAFLEAFRSPDEHFGAAA